MSIVGRSKDDKKLTLLTYMCMCVYIYVRDRKYGFSVVVFFFCFFVFGDNVSHSGSR